MALRDMLKLYGEDRLVEDKGAVQIVGLALSEIKIKRVTVKVKEENVAQDKSGI